MAVNKSMDEFCYSLEKKKNILFFNFVVAGSGAVYHPKGLGITNIEKKATGKYLITLDDAIQNILFFRGGFVYGSAINIEQVQILQAPATLNTALLSKQFYIQCLGFNGAAANPTSGSAFSAILIFKNTGVKPSSGAL